MPKPLLALVLMVVIGCLNGPGVARAQLDAGLDLDRLRREGADTFARTISRLERRREELAHLRAEYQTDCVGRRTRVPPSKRGRTPYLDDEMVDNRQLPACRSAARRIETRARSLGEAIAQAEERARRAGVYPGTMREILRLHGFDRLSRQ